jgi:hypothetical protein
MMQAGRWFLNRTSVQFSAESLSSETQALGRRAPADDRRPTYRVPKLTLIIATAASMLCMLALFAVAALASGRVSDAPAQVGGKARPAAGLCFLHRL